MIVNQALTDAKREGFIASYKAAYGERSVGAAHHAEEAFPYMQERVITVTVHNTPTLLKVQAEDDHDPETGLSAGTLLKCGTGKRSRWESAWIDVKSVSPADLRAIAALFDSPLEKYVAPQLEVATPQADGDA
jgi:hypothetical protein